jgi:hypothetical protein
LKDIRDIDNIDKVKDMRDIDNIDKVKDIDIMRRNRKL